MPRVRRCGRPWREGLFALPAACLSSLRARSPYVPRCKQQAAPPPMCARALDEEEEEEESEHARRWRLERERHWAGISRYFAKAKERLSFFFARLPVGSDLNKTARSSVSFI